MVAVVSAFSESAKVLSSLSGGPGVHARVMAPPGREDSEEAPLALSM